MFYVNDGCISVKVKKTSETWSDFSLENIWYENCGVKLQLSKMTDDEIYSFWVTRYGERIITNPINRNLELLLIPLFLISVFILLFIRKLYVKK